MASFTKLSYHIIFSTKYRERTINNDFRERLYEYIGGTIRGLDGHSIQIGGVEDHVHILANLSPARAVSDVVRDVKAGASKWVNENSLVKQTFLWQKGYAAFSVSHSQVETVARYIQNQKEHHRTRTFTEEYIEFLEKHGIEYDRRYLFESEVHG